MNRGEKICTLYTFLSCEGIFKWRVEGFPHNYDVTLYAIRIDSSTAKKASICILDLHCSRNTAQALTAKQILMLKEPVNSDINWLDVTLYAFKIHVLSCSLQFKGR